MSRTASRVTFSPALDVAHPEEVDETGLSVRQKLAHLRSELDLPADDPLVPTVDAACLALGLEN